MNLNKKGTVADVIERYFKTLEFKKKITNNKTKTQYTYLLQRLINTPLENGERVGS